MKRLFKVGGIILIVGVLALAIGFFNGGNKTVYFENARPIVIHDHVKHLSTNQKFNRLNLNVSTANVVIRQGSKYKITYYGMGGHIPTASVKNGTATVRQDGTISYSFNLNNYRDQNLIVITVPHGQALRGKLQLKEGDLKLEKLTLQKMAVLSHDGDIDYQQVTVNGGKTSLKEGDFNAQKLTVQGHYTVDNNDGDNTVTKTTVDGYYLATTNGDNELNGEDKGSQTLGQNENAANVLHLLNDDGDNEVN